MKFRKQNLFLLAVLIVGIVSINTFVFPKEAENCSCYMGEEVEQIICNYTCIGECEVIHHLGRCSDDCCLSSHTINCIDGGYSEMGYWSEPSCWQCLSGGQ